MALEHNFYQNFRTDGTKFVAFDNSGTDTETLTPRDRVVRVDSSLGAGTIYLPKVAECAGQIICILKSDSGTNDVNIYDQDDSENWSDMKNGGTFDALDAQNDYVVLLSDGRKWYILGCAGPATDLS